MVDNRFFNHLGPFSLVELIDGLDVELLEGSYTDIAVNHTTPIDKASQGDITYFEGRRRAAEKVVCNASVCLVSEENASALAAQGTVPVISKSPRADFARLMGKMYSQKTEFTAENPVFEGVELARGVVIGADVLIGKGTRIGPNSVIGNGVSIGENCRIDANVVIEFSDVGDSCVIRNGAVIGGNGFGVAVSDGANLDIPHIGIVKIGNNVSIGCLTTIDRAMFGQTTIGNGCKFDNLVQIAHNVQVGPNCLFAAHTGISGSCVIGAGVRMGGRVGLADHLQVGDGAILAANAGAMHNIPAGEMWSGIPAIPIRQHMRQISAVQKLVKPKTK